MLDPLRLSLPWPSCRSFQRDGATVASALGGNRMPGGPPRVLTARLPSTLPVPPRPARRAGGAPRTDRP